MKLRKLWMDNFKSMNDFDMEFGNLVIIAGNNSAGKTTILHALDFLRYACTSDLDRYLEDRGFKYSELLSQFSNKKTISAQITFENNGCEIIWNIAFLLSKSGFILSHEKVVCDNTTFLEVKRNVTKVYNTFTNQNTKYLTLPLNSSYIRYLKNSTEYPPLSAIKAFFENSEFMDLLSPIDMRKPNRTIASTIGQKGALLSGFIKQLNQDSRTALVNDIKKYFPPISSIKVTQNGRGWFRIATNETFGEKEIQVSAEQISDGMLRLIAMYSLKYLERQKDFKEGFLILDEIEDGINTENLEGVYLMCKDLSESGFQIVITTHSTVVLDYAEPNEIWYAARRDNGNLAIASMKQIKLLMELLIGCYPGEAILNTNDNEIKASLIDYLDSKIKNNGKET